MSVLDLIAALAGGYFLGGLPSAYLAARLAGRNVFELGSGNMGAMNVARHLGVAWGVVVFAADVGKGSLAALLGGAMGAVAGLDPAGGGEAMALGAGVGAVAGHAWSPYVRFRGGKALATAFGAALPIYPVPAVYAVVLLVALALITRRTTASALVALAAYPPLTAWTLEGAGWARERVFAVVTAVTAIAAIAALRHLLAARREGRKRA